MAQVKTIRDLTLDSREHIVATVRQGAIGIIPHLLLPAVLIITPFFFLYILFSRGTLGVLVFFAIFVLGVTLGARRLLLWYTQALIITNQRIIDIDRRGLFKRMVSLAPLDRIIDAYYESIGLWQTLNKSGNIIIILNDGKTKFEFKNVARPERTLQIIHDLRKKHTADFNGTSLTAQELVQLVKKIKTGLGEKKFQELIAEDTSPDLAAE